MRYHEFAIEEKKTIASVVPVSADKLSKSEIKQAYSKLSAVELAQLGTPGYISYEDWPRFRRFLVERSLASNPSLDPKYTAYTPGETLHLLNDPVISAWHREIISYVVPEHYSMVAFVPCAKTKPWAGASKGLYKSYNKLINDNRYPVYFVTVSEPLGIVPQSLWSDFPQYDNPGLFKDNVQRTGGMFTSDWARLFGTGQQKIPFDGEAYIKCVTALSSVIKQFIQHNSSKKFLSFVEDKKFNPKNKNVGTHSDMLSRTGSIPDENRLLKRAKSRAEPYDYIDAELNSRIAQQEPEDDAETKEVKLNEEISLSKYDPEVKKVILTGMVKALKDVYQAYWADDDEYENSKKEYNKGNTEKFYKLMEVDLLNHVAYEVNDALYVLGYRIEPALQEIDSKLLNDNIGGYAQGYKIVMNRNVIAKITSLICKVIKNNVEKKYVIGELLKGLYSVVEEMIENGGIDLLEFSDLKKAINEYASTFIHELVHVVQHARQKHRGGKFEFRSHLDKEKNEFAKLARKNSVFPSDNSASSPKLSREEQARYYDLYFASTAEIAAHAHNIALGIIRRYSLEQPRPVKSSYINVGNNALREITRLIDGYLDKRYKGKTDPKVQAVYKRYHKLVYQEVYKQIQDTLNTANFKE